MTTESPLTTDELNSLESLLPFATERELARIQSLLAGPTETVLRKYCPHKPFPKQQTFLDLECREAFYGGGAGPGKTDALLMAALQYVDVPGYAALILRRDFPRLNMAMSIMHRAGGWLAGTDAKWNGIDHRFTFPTGATLQFGVMDNLKDRWRYQSAEFQFIGWDELTEIQLNEGEENPYLFLLSRLRRPKCSKHDRPDPTCYVCRTNGPLQQVPLRVRSASNPGGVGHQWVKSRFVTDDAIAALQDGQPRVFYADEANEDRAFVPALLRDNPALDYDEYVKGSLMQLPPILRARLLAGDWSVIEDALIRLEWLRYFTMRGEILEPLNADGDKIDEIHDVQCQRFATIDTAGTSKQKAEEKKGKPASWSVCGIWDYWPKPDFLFLRHVWRARVDYIDLRARAEEVLGQWRPSRVFIENAHLGPALIGDLKLAGLPAEGLNPVTKSMKGQSGVPGKVERATDLLNRLEAGKLFLPRHDNAWLPVLESEWLSWTGLVDQPDDQVDMASYAAGHVGAADQAAGSKLDFAFWKGRGTGKMALPRRF